MESKKNKDIKAIGKLIVEGFSEDPKMKYQLKNVERKQLILQSIAESQVREFIEKGEVYTTDNYEGAILGYNSKKLDFNGFLQIIIACNNDLKEVITEEEMATLISNGQRLDKVDNPTWFNEMAEEYYHLMVIAVDKKFKGKGIFRKLISPLLKECDEKKIPILLETHNEDNIDIYKHFGFEIVKEFSDENLDFKQYCMIRQPN